LEDLNGVDVRVKVVYHEMYRRVYTSDPAAKPGRMESIYNELYGHFDFVPPEPASKDDLKLVHGEDYINSVKRNGTVYEAATLAVGGAVKAAELAVEGEPAFGLIRPPGHHASRDSGWGFCYFNNIAVSVEKLRQAGKIRAALIVDIDLHYGDGTASIFNKTPEVSYFHVGGRDRTEYLNNLTEHLTSKKGFDLIALSAGFDRHEEDWGHMLKTEDYMRVGAEVKEFSSRVCGGKRYAVLEGGYNLQVLGRNVRSLLEGLR